MAGFGGWTGFGPGAAGSSFGLGAVGVTVAPTARAASPVVLKLATGGLLLRTIPRAVIDYQHGQHAEARDRQSDEHRCAALRALQSIAMIRIDIHRMA